MTPPDSVNRLAIHDEQELIRRWWDEVRSRYPEAWHAIAAIGVLVNLITIPVDLINATGGHHSLLIGLRLAGAAWFAAMGLITRLRPEWMKRHWLQTLLASFVFFSVLYTLVSLFVNGIDNHYYAAIIEVEFVVAAFGMLPVWPFAVTAILLNVFYIVIHQSAGLISGSSELVTLSATLFVCATIAIITLHRMIQLQLRGFAELQERTALSMELEDCVAAQTLRLQRLNEHLNEQIEVHRRNLSRELHDDLGQLLSIIVQTVDALEPAAARLDERERGRLFLLQEVAAKAVASVRRIAAESGQPGLVEADLAAAIRADIRRIEATGALSVGCAIQSLAPLAAATSVAVYRIWQEASNNALRHAGATTLQVFAAVSSGVLTLTVRDNGRGFDPDESKPDQGVGLELMRQRARLIGADLSIESRPGQGTIVRLTLPLDDATRPDEAEEPGA